MEKCEVRFDVLNAECCECEYRDKCRAISNSKTFPGKVAMLDKVRDMVVGNEEYKSNGIKSTMGVFNRILILITDNNIRKERGWRDRRDKIKPEIEKISKLPPSEAKTSLVFRCAEYVVIGG